MLRCARRTVWKHATEEHGGVRTAAEALGRWGRSAAAERRRGSSVQGMWACERHGSSRCTPQREQVCAALPGQVCATRPRGGKRHGGGRCKPTVRQRERVRLRANVWACERHGHRECAALHGQICAALKGLVQGTSRRHGGCHGRPWVHTKRRCGRRFGGGGGPSEARRQHGRKGSCSLSRDDSGTGSGSVFASQQF